MADRCSFCGSTAGPFSKVEGLFTVLMCADCQAARAHSAGPYPMMTRAQMRAGLDLMATWAPEQKAAAFSYQGQVEPRRERTDLLWLTARPSRGSRAERQPHRGR
jgi:hypothetical protein